MPSFTGRFLRGVRAEVSWTGVGLMSGSRKLGWPATIGFGIALCLGVVLYQKHLVSLGTVYAFVQYTGMMANPLAQIAMQLQQFADRATKALCK